MSHIPENWTKVGGIFPDEIKIKLKHETFLNYRYIFDVMCLEK